MPKTKTKEIKIRIAEVKKLSFYEKLLVDQEVQIKLDKGNIPIDINLRLGIDFPNNTCTMILSVDFYKKLNEKKYNLFGISTSHKFHIGYIKRILKKEKEGKSSIDKKVLATLLGMAISGTRGMLSILNTSDDYKDIILPAINPMEFIKNSKQNFMVMEEVN